jgi:thermostable 8-oxoguanine DNA glycosylase
MINPEKVTNYDQTDRQLEEFILFWVCAAGKNGRTAARCLDRMLTEHAACYQNNTPFRWILNMHALFDLPQTLKHYGIGCYNSKAKTFYELAVAKHKGVLDLRTCAASDLEAIHGIGQKTARCFLLHSRKNAQVAGIDTHMLKHLRALGYPDIPKSTPSGKKYLTIENYVLSLAKEAGMSPAEYDLHIWNKYSVKSTPKDQ